MDAKRVWGRLAHRALTNRRFVRSPIWLYRHRLGWVLGSRFLLLQNTGRASGMPRLAVLEVVDRPRPGTYRVISGLGEGSQWLRNVRANPLVRVSSGFLRDRPATAHVHASDAAAQVLESYARAHPAAWAALSPVLDGVRTDDADPWRGIPVVDLVLDEPAAHAPRGAGRDG